MRADKRKKESIGSYTRLLNHTSLLGLLPFATPSDKVFNSLIFMIVSRLIAVELKAKNEETIDQLYQYSGSGCV